MENKENGFYISKAGNKIEASGSKRKKIKLQKKKAQRKNKKLKIEYYRIYQKTIGATLKEWIKKRLES